MVTRHPVSSLIQETNWIGATQLPICYRDHHLCRQDTNFTDTHQPHFCDQIIASRQAVTTDKGAESARTYRKSSRGIHPLIRCLCQQTKVTATTHKVGRRWRKGSWGHSSLDPDVEGAAESGPGKEVKWVSFPPSVTPPAYE